MKTIGQFAKKHNISTKTLHHYEKLDLLHPIKVDQESGYRYYDDSQSSDVKMILFLKELGLSLSEVKELIQKDYSKESLKEFMIFKRKQSEQDLDSTSRRLYKIESIIQVINQSSSINVKELINMSEEQLFTGKYGRGKFLELTEKAFNQAMDEDTPLSFISMDLDKFQKVNQTYGYEVGDVVLQRTQDEIISVLQRSAFNTLFERKGGDEFNVLVEAKAMDAAKLATEILNAVVDVDYSDVAENLKITITAGIASRNKRTKSASDLMHQATIKLYEQKRQ